MHHDFSRLSIASSAQGCLKHKPLLLVRLQICSYVITVVQDGGTEVQQTNRKKLPGFFSLSYGKLLYCILGLKKDLVSSIFLSRYKQCTFINLDSAKLIS